MIPFGIPVTYLKENTEACADVATLRLSSWNSVYLPRTLKNTGAFRMELITEFKEINALLETYRAELGSNYDAYRNHLYRMMNFTLFLNGPDDVNRAALEVAGFFHDLDFILRGNTNYLEPSADAARTYLDETNRSDLAPLVTALIVWHHKITPYKGDQGRIVECFRLADLVDLSLGLIRAGVDKPFIKEAQRAFPNAGFHKVLFKTLVPYALTHPFKPMPMMRG